MWMLKSLTLKIVILVSRIPTDTLVTVLSKKHHTLSIIDKSRVAAINKKKLYHVDSPMNIHYISLLMLSFLKLFFNILVFNFFSRFPYIL